MRKKILLIRHARPDFPEGVLLCLGRNTDPGLCTEGIEQTEVLRKNIEQEIRSAGRIYTSPLKRAQETAKILAGGGVPVIPEQGMIEMDTGEWDGLDFDTIQKRYPELYASRAYDFSIPPPGGETFSDASKRMRTTLKRLAEIDNDRLLIAVSHSGTIRAFLCDVMGVDYKDNRSIPFEYANVVSVYYDSSVDNQGKFVI